MNVKQISVFIENKSGRMAEITKLLADNNINIHALSLADTTDFGILRIIVSDPIATEKVLKENGCIVQITDVIAVLMDDKPGGLNRILNPLNAVGIEIEYMYAFNSKINEYAMLILRTENCSEAIGELKKNNIKVLSFEEVNNL